MDAMAGVAEQVKEVAAATRKMESKININRNIIERASKVLEAILRQPNPQENQKLIKPAKQTKLSREIAELAERLEENNRCLSDILDRLEI